MKIEKPELAGLQAIEVTTRAFADAVEGAGAAPAIARLLDEFHWTSPAKSQRERSRDFFSTQRELPGHCNPINLAGFSFAMRSISACVNPCPRNPA
jgi:hypothetical protein